MVTSYIDTTTHCLYGPKANNAWPTTCVTLVGPQELPERKAPPERPAHRSYRREGRHWGDWFARSAGTNGNTVWNGTSTPASTTGVNGDFYLDNNDALSLQRLESQQRMADHVYQLSVHRELRERKARWDRTVSPAP